MSVKKFRVSRWLQKYFRKSAVAKIWLKEHFFLNCFWWNRSPYCFLYFPLPPLRGQPTANCHPRWKPISGQPSTVGWGDCWIWTQDCSFTIWCRYQWATTAFFLETWDFLEQLFFGLFFGVFFLKCSSIRDKSNILNILMPKLTYFEKRFCSEKGL